MTRLPQLLLTAALLITATGGQAALRAVEQVYELGLRSVTLPAGASGQLLVRRCTNCRAEPLRVDATTRYFVRPGESMVTLNDLRAAAGRAALRRAPYIYIYYEPHSRVARRVVLDPGP